MAGMRLGGRTGTKRVAYVSFTCQYKPCSKVFEVAPGRARLHGGVKFCSTDCKANNARKAIAQWGE